MEDWEKYFEKYGKVTFFDPGWGWEPLTVELMFKMFKARIEAPTNTDGE